MSFHPRGHVLLVSPNLKTNWKSLKKPGDTVGVPDVPPARAGEGGAGWEGFYLTAFLSAFSALAVYSLAPINMFKNVLITAPDTIKLCLPHAYGGWTHARVCACEVSL